MRQAEITAAEAKAILEKENQEIIEKCTAEIQEILNKYDCQLDVSVIIKATGNVPQVAIIRKS
jgi:hypothetical protein